MESAITSRLTTKWQATIPGKIRGILDLQPGDSVAFEVTADKKVFVRKAMPIDLEFARAIEATLASEWLSENDQEAYRDLYRNTIGGPLQKH
jgi:AbrB family looped-hinge helix DNA binding protein